MKKQFIFIILFFAVYNVFPQLYFGDQDYVYYYVDLKNDSASLEMFKDNLSSVEKKSYEILYKRSGEVLFANAQNKIIKQKNKLYLLHQELGSNKIIKVKLDLCQTDVREGLRMESHYHLRKVQLEKLKDSLAGSTSKSTFTLEKSIDWNSSAAYIADLDRTFDSLSRKITRKADANAVRAYAIMDSIPQREASELLEYLKKAKYEYYYGQSLIYRIGVNRPEVLIAFLNRNPERQDEILKVIREHKYYREIIASVKSWPEKTPVKKEIEKQKRKRQWKDARYNTGLKVLLGVQAVVIIGVILFFATK